MRGRDSGLRRGTLDWLLLLSGEEKWASRVGGVRRRGSSSRAGGAEARRGTWKRGRESGGQSLHRRSQAIWDLAQPQGGAGGAEDLRGVARGVLGTLSAGWGLQAPVGREGESDCKP